MLRSRLRLTLRCAAARDVHVRPTGQPHYLQHAYIHVHTCLTISKASPKPMEEIYSLLLLYFTTFYKLQLASILTLLAHATTDFKFSCPKTVPPMVKDWTGQLRSVLNADYNLSPTRGGYETYAQSSTVSHKDVLHVSGAVGPSMNML